MPTYLDVRADMIPAALRALPAVLWRAEPRGEDKPAKVPYRIADPERRASSTDPSTWGSFADAIEAYHGLVTLPSHPDLGPIAGLGVVLTVDAGITCLDLDHVLEGDTLDPRGQRIVAHCDSWTERSPSGTGLHIFGHGRVRAIKGEQIEVYSTVRYIALTGHHWPGTPDTLRDLQSYLDRLATLDQPAPRVPWTGPSVPPPDDLAGALLAKLATWGLRTGPIKRWEDGYLLELPACPWASAHTQGGPGGAAVMIRASGAFDFTCLHAHCSDRNWRAFRDVMDPSRR